MPSAGSAIGIAIPFFSPSPLLNRVAVRVARALKGSVEQHSNVAGIWALRDRFEAPSIGAERRQVTRFSGQVVLPCSHAPACGSCPAWPDYSYTKKERQTYIQILKYSRGPQRSLVEK